MSNEQMADLPGALRLAMPPQEGEWSRSTDALAWARAWMETIEKHPEIHKDEGTMIGWFANAIMAGYDEANRRNAAPASPDPTEVGGEVESVAHPGYFNSEREARLEGIQHDSAEIGVGVEQGVCEPGPLPAFMYPPPLQSTLPVRMVAPDGPLRVWWQGSGPERGDHVMQGRQHVAYIAADGDKDRDHKRHEAVGALIYEHNCAMTALRQRIAELEAGKASCPHVATSRDGTSYCRLAEASAITAMEGAA